MPHFTASYFRDLGQAWQRAYEDANGKPAPEIRYRKDGWFVIEGQLYRRIAVERMTRRLREQSDQTIG